MGYIDNSTGGGGGITRLSVSAEITASRKLELTDENTVLLVGETEAEGSVTITVPTNAEAAFPTGSRVWLTMVGGKDVLVKPGEGVELVRLGSTVGEGEITAIHPKSIHTPVALVKVGTNLWYTADAEEWALTE